jgi:hypothetical protein
MGNPHVEITKRLFNGFNNGRDTTDGVGGRPAFDDTYQPITSAEAPGCGPQLSTHEYLLERINNLEKMVYKLITKMYDLEHPHSPGSMAPHSPRPTPEAIINDFESNTHPTYVKTTVTAPIAH